IEALRSCLAGLGPRARELLRLRYTEDLGREAIAERLAASVDAVKKGMTRARSALARCIEQRRVTT
nr:sigma factor-like helix-turn-helix DNA-binding protein [Planctomycetota bacterium]